MVAHDRELEELVGPWIKPEIVKYGWVLPNELKKRFLDPEIKDVYPESEEV